MVVLKFSLSTELSDEGACRNFSSIVQKLRKEYGLTVVDKIDVYIKFNEDSGLGKFFKNNESFLFKNLLSTMNFYFNANNESKPIGEKEQVFMNEKVTITLYFSKN
jgi:hypothetical protein